MNAIDRTARNDMFRNFLRPLVYLVGFGCLYTAAARASFEPVSCKNSFSQEQEISEGHKVALQVYQQMPVMAEGDPMTRYIQQLGARLVQRAPLVQGVQQQWPFTFHVVASPDINAFALPGGDIFVNLGTIQNAQTEAQLAGVMAHEISHVVMRHSTCNLVKQQHRSILYGLGEIGSAILLGNGTAGQIAQAGLGMGQNLQFLSMSREDEQQADLLGVNILNQGGYDPRGLPQFFEIIQSKTGPGGAQFLSDHPNPGNRTEYVNREIATLQRAQNPIVSTQEFVRVHGISESRQALSAEQVKQGGWRNSGQYSSGPGQNGYPQQGQNYPQQTQNSPQRGQNYPQQGQNYPQQGQNYPQQGQNYPQQGQNYPQQGQNYPQQGQNYPQQGQNYPQQGQGYPQQQGQQGHTIAPLRATQLGLRDRMVSVQGPRSILVAPTSWQQNTDQKGSITYAPQGGNGGYGLAYGAMVGYAELGDNGIDDAQSMAAATNVLVQQFMRDSNLTQESATTSFTVGGQQAQSSYLRGSSPVVVNGRQMVERDWVVTIARPDGDLNFFVFVAPQQNFSSLQPLFNRMLAGFHTQE